MNKAQEILSAICLIAAIICFFTDINTATYFVALGCYNLIAAEAAEIKDRIDKMK